MTKSSTSLFPKADSFQEYSAQKRIEPQNLSTWREQIADEGKTLATLNGSFDLLHAGHMHMIFEASKQADLLLVALNSDSSIKAYKDSRRPIIPLEYRLQMMSALSFVDHVTWFEETDPINFLSVARPDVHVNGAEYGENCIEAPIVQKHGGKIHIVELIPGLSTSQIINKILAICD